MLSCSRAAIRAAGRGANRAGGLSCLCFFARCCENAGMHAGGAAAPRRRHVSSGAGKPPEVDRRTGSTEESKRNKRQA